MATAALFCILAVAPGIILAGSMTNLCFTSSERWDESSGKWVLADFDDYMVSGCPEPYGYTNPTDLYPNATAGRW